jgi:16S rRNA processing protein RimM
VLRETRRASTFRLNFSTDRNESGSSPEPIVVGFVRRAHGIRGAVIIRPLTDDPARFEVGSEFSTDDASGARLTLVDVRAHKEGLLAALDGIEDRNAAEKLRGVSLLIDPTERRTLEDNEYWPEDLIGLSVFDLAGLRVGDVVDVLQGYAQDRLLVASRGAEFEVPFVADLVTEVDLAGEKVIVDLPEGLAELNRAVEHPVSGRPASSDESGGSVDADT